MRNVKYFFNPSGNKSNYRISAQATYPEIFNGNLWVLTHGAAANLYKNNRACKFLANNGNLVVSKTSRSHTERGLNPDDRGNYTVKNEISDSRELFFYFLNKFQKQGYPIRRIIFAGNSAGFLESVKNANYVYKPDLVIGLDGLGDIMKVTYKNFSFLNGKLLYKSRKIVQKILKIFYNNKIRIGDLVLNKKQLKEFIKGFKDFRLTPEELSNINYCSYHSYHDNFLNPESWEAFNPKAKIGEVFIDKNDNINLYENEIIHCGVMDAENKISKIFEKFSQHLDFDLLEDKYCEQAVLDNVSDKIRKKLDINYYETKDNINLFPDKKTKVYHVDLLPIEEEYIFVDKLPDNKFTFFDLLSEKDKKKYYSDLLPSNKEKSYLQKEVINLLPANSFINSSISLNMPTVNN